MWMLEEVIMEKDEMEVVRLCDLNGDNMIEAADKMGLSKSTVHRILASAHGKIAEALIKGKAINIGRE